ncbi:MAG TPA: GNAT family N-acetyltransferase [Vicinamibacterales bacterium]
MTTPPAVVIETERLILRRLCADDAPFILGLLNEPSFLEFIGDKGVRTLDAARDYIAGQVRSYERFGFGLYLTVRRIDDAAIGICGLVKRDALSDVDLGFAFRPPFWSRGYAFESAEAMLQHATGPLGLAQVVAIADPGNVSSIRLLEKLGFRSRGPVRLVPDGPELTLFSLRPRAVGLQSR